MDDGTREKLRKCGLGIFGAIFSSSTASVWFGHRAGSGTGRSNIICDDLRRYAVLGAFLIRRGRDPRSIAPDLVTSGRALCMPASWRTVISDVHETGHLIGDVPAFAARCRCALVSLAGQTSGCRSRHTQPAEPFGGPGERSRALMS